MELWYDEALMDEKNDSYRMVDALQQNAKDLKKDLDWFLEVLEARMDLYFERESKYKSISDIPAPKLKATSSYYSEFLVRQEFNVNERIAFILTLIPYVQPRLLDILFTRNSTYDKEFTEFGGAKSTSHKGFIPTGETLVFLLAGDDLASAFRAQMLFDSEHFFNRHDIIYLNQVEDGSPALSGALQLSKDVLDYVTKGTISKPTTSKKFPARLITTELAWTDLVLNSTTKGRVAEINTWMDHHETLMIDWDMKKKLRPGYRCLFHGPPGTGKSMTACLLGKTNGQDVYKIDLSMVVSKYIGETEKNLSRIFDLAEHKNWILFFDEADALFGKRTGVSNSHDRYANQEVSFLLQRIEVFDGVIILASNMKGNLDEAFSRRFESIIYFPMPAESERHLLWKQGIPKGKAIGKDVDLGSLASQYELSGGSIMNVIGYSSLMALKHEDQVIRLLDIEEGIRREYIKEGRTI